MVNGTSQLEIKKAELLQPFLFYLFFGVGICRFFQDQG